MHLPMSTVAVFIIVVSLITTQTSGQVASPENVALLEGESLQLNFLSPSSMFFVTWLEFTTEVTGKTVFLNGSKVWTGDATKSARFDQRMEVFNSSAVLHKLFLNDTVMSDGGLYEAREMISSNTKRAEVIILECDINCTWTGSNPALPSTPLLAGDTVTIRCHIPYVGRWGPIFTCTSARLTNWTFVDDSKPNLAAYNFTAQVMNGMPSTDIDCDALFNNPAAHDTLTAGNADNIPSYTSQWTSGSVDIYYPPSSVSAASAPTMYSVGDVVECAAVGGNPPPVYKWVYADTSILLSSASGLILTSDMAGKSLNVTCIVTTTIHGTEYSLSTTIEFQVSNTTAVTDTPSGVETSTRRSGDFLDDNIIVIIVISVIAGVLAIVLISIIAVCCTKKVLAEDRRPMQENQRSHFPGHGVRRSSSYSDGKLHSTPSSLLWMTSTSSQYTPSDRHRAHTLYHPSDRHHRASSLYNPSDRHRLSHNMIT